MKHLIITIISFFVVSCTSEITRNEFTGLYGKVNSVNVISYEAVNKSGKWIEGEVFGRRFQTFDRNNNLLIDEFYQGASLLDETYEYEFNKKGKLKKSWRYNRNGQLLNEFTYNYRSIDNSTFVSYNDEGDIVGEGKVFAGKENTVLSNATFFEDGEVDEKVHGIKKFNDDGFQDLEMLINENNDTVQYIRYEYIAFDDLGNWTKRLNYGTPNASEPSSISIQDIEYK